MPKSATNQYLPDSVTPPGATLDDALKSVGMTQRELALRTGRPVKTINEIIKGKAPITPDTALQLQQVLGISSTFWNTRERNYREFLAQRKDEERLSSLVGWLRKTPVNELVTLEWIGKRATPVAQLRELLGYFGVTSPTRYEHLKMKLLATAQVDFRKSAAYKADPDALMAWLRMGEIRAQSIVCRSFDAARFERTLVGIRELTQEPPEVFQEELVRRCAQCGVAVAFVRELRKTRTSGATRWLTPQKALIQLSLRYKSDDMLWFSFFHEAGHVLLHNKRSLFLEQAQVRTDVEEEANVFAQDILIPEKRLSEFVGTGTFSGVAIREFADKIGIGVGLVVGRLQHEGYLRRSHLNGLKVSLVWGEGS